VATMTLTLLNEESIVTINSTSDDSGQLNSSTSNNITYNNRNRPRPSILVLGASSRTGLECIQQLSQHPSKPYIHAFYEEDLPVLDDEYIKLCHTILEGSTRHAIDIEEALIATSAKWVISCNNSSEKDIQKLRRKDHSTVSARNVVRVLEQKQFESVRVLIVSRIEAVTTKRMLHNVRCKLMAIMSRPVLQDIIGQEKQIHSIWDRTTIVRTSRLADSRSNSSRRLIIEMSDEEARKSLNFSLTERADLVSYIVDEVCAHQVPSGNRVINVMSAKTPRQRIDHDDGDDYKRKQPA
jgi:hypothetical protein